MLGYALLTALKHEYGYRVFMEGRDLEHLSYFFKNIDELESLEVLCNETDAYPWENNINAVKYLGDDNLRFGRAIDYLWDVS